MGDHWLRTAVAARLRQKRKAAGLTQVQMVERLGGELPQETISAVERGAREITMRHIELYAMALGVDPVVFFEGLSDPRKGR